MKQISKLRATTIFLFALILFAAGITNAQIGIGIANPAVSAQLDVSSTAKGFLPPRMTLAQRNAIVSPTAGLTIWCKNCGVLGELQVYNGATWTNMTGGYSSTPIPPTVTIGTQVWMTKNLNVVTYRNGDTIPEVKDSAQWANLTTGAWCYYNNDPALGAVYGKLYNRAAVVDPRGLAPQGWHIPKDSFYIYQSSGGGGGEWELLSTYLGGGDVAGGKMRATTLWNSTNNVEANESGFTGLPGGQRNADGSFSSLGSLGRWWSSGYYQEKYGGTFSGQRFRNSFVSSSLNTNSFNLWELITYEDYGSNLDGSWNNQFPAGNGFSVRCVRD